MVETNIHHPTDRRLLGDGVRVVSRLLRRAKEVIGEAADLGPRVFRTRTRTRTVRRLTQQIHRVLKRSYGLGCCLNHGEQGYERWVGWGIVTANLATISRAQSARQT